MSLRPASCPFDQVSNTNYRHADGSSRWHLHDRPGRVYRAAGDSRAGVLRHLPKSPSRWLGLYLPGFVPSRGKMTGADHLVPKQVWDNSIVVMI